MLTIAEWALGAVVLAGIGLAGFWLQERRPPTWAGAVHGLAGLAGTAIVLALVVAAPDRQGFGRLAALFLATALAAGAVVAVATLRRRRPSGLVVALHAIVGLAGFVLLLAFGAVRSG